MFRPRLSHSLCFGLLLCFGCGSKFEPGEGDGSAAGSAHAGASPSAGQPGSGASGGESAGGADTAGDTGSAGSPAAGSGAAADGGTTSSGGKSSGGSGSVDCAALKTEYAALVKKARVCQPDAKDECSTASTAPNVGGCGCPTLVNANSEYTALAAEKYKAIQKGSCTGGLICNAACLPPTAASCAQSSDKSSQEFVCTGVYGGIAN